MVCNVFDLNLNPLGTVFSWISLVWDEYYNALGEAQLELAYTEDNAALVKANRYLNVATGTIGSGEVYTLYRENGRLYVEKSSGGVTSDAFGMLDYTSDLYTLHAGVNRLRVQADSGASMLVVSVNVKTAVAGVYDGM